MGNLLKNYIGNKVSNWYQLHGRHNLPWRKNITPYRIWISEIMLQQTQVNTAIDYFNRFMKQYPDLKSIKSAREDDIYGLWSVKVGFWKGSFFSCTDLCAFWVVRLGAVVPSETIYSSKWSPIRNQTSNKGQA